MKHPVSNEEARKLRDLLMELGREVQGTLLRERSHASAEDWAEVAHESEADTIYAVDKVSEEAIFAWLEAHWPAAHPIALVMEGIEDAHPPTFPKEVSPLEAPWTLLVDPIDGTRNLMYDKRAAWFVAGLARRENGRSTLADMLLGALVELPTTKQHLVDELGCVRGLGWEGVMAVRRSLTTGDSVPLVVRPSSKPELNHGFGSIAKFFPEGKTKTAELEEAILGELGLTGHTSPQVFDDQYMSTGGQLYELAMGHDRFLADLRPVILPLVGQEATLACHPYDIAAWPILEAVGGIVEQPDGSPLDANLDTTSPVAWVGYANEAIAELVRPVLQKKIGELR